VTIVTGALFWTAGLSTAPCHSKLWSEFQKQERLWRKCFTAFIQYRRMREFVRSNLPSLQSRMSVLCLTH